VLPFSYCRARAVPPLHWRNMPHDSLLHTNDRFANSTCPLNALTPTGKIMKSRSFKDDRIGPLTQSDSARSSGLQWHLDQHRPLALKPFPQRLRECMSEVTRLPGTPIPFAKHTQSRSGRPISNISGARRPDRRTPTRNSRLRTA